jgi:hypothetical protein
MPTSSQLPPSEFPPIDETCLKSWLNSAAKTCTLVVSDPTACQLTLIVGEFTHVGEVEVAGPRWSVGGLGGVRSTVQE